MTTKIKASNIEAGAVTADKISNGAVTANHISSGAITAEKLHGNAISGALGFTPANNGNLRNLANKDTISTNDIEDGAVTSSKLAAGAAVPNQSGQSGKFLTTNGTDASWASLEVTPAAVSDQNNTSTGYFIVPIGTTLQRPISPSTGMIRYNTDLGLLENYNSQGWVSIDAPPAVTNYSGTINENTDSILTVTGSGFKSGSIVYIEGAAVNGTPRSLTTSYVSTTQLTAQTNAASVNYIGGASFDIKVTNPSGLSSVLSSAGNVDRDPVWSTSAGTIATINDAYGSYSPITTLSASDPDGGSIVYSIASGSLPGNVSLNTSTGAISGDPNNVENNTTYSFTVNATSNNQSTPRSFNIIVNKVNDGTTSARAGTTASAIKSATSTTTNGYYWLTTPSDGVARQWWCDMNTDGGGYVLIARASSYLSGNPGNWYDSAHAGGFSPSSSGFYRGGGYFNNTSQNYIMFEVQASSTVRKARFYWQGYNFNTIPSRNFNAFSENISNAPQFASSYNGFNSSIKGMENFSQQFCISFSGRSAGGNMDKGEWGAYYLIGAHYNGSHQHHEESLPNGDYDGTGAVMYGGDWKYSNWGGSGGLGEGQYGGYINIWAKV
jgi:hypothetical protein